MELNQLIQFKTVSEMQSLAKAAEALGITQPALSMSMKKLAEELGQPLFEKSGRKNVLSAAGELLLNHANAILIQVEVLKADFKKFAQTDTNNTLTVYSSGITMIRHFSTLFAQSGMGLSIKAEICAHNEMCAKLKALECDICFTDKPLTDKDILSMPVCTYRVLISVPYTNRLAKKTSLKWEDLNGETFLSFEGSISEPLVSNMKKILKEKKVRIKYIRTRYDDFLFAAIIKSSDYLCFTNNITEKYTPRGTFENRTVLRIADKGAVCPLYINYLKENNRRVALVRSWIRDNYMALMV